MNEELVQNSVMNEQFVKNFVTNAKLDPKVVMDLYIFFNWCGIMWFFVSLALRSLVCMLFFRWVT